MSHLYCKACQLSPLEIHLSDSEVSPSFKQPLFLLFLVQWPPIWPPCYPPSKLLVLTSAKLIFQNITSNHVNQQFKTLQWLLTPLSIKSKLSATVSKLLHDLPWVLSDLIIYHCRHVGAAPGSLAILFFTSTLPTSGLYTLFPLSWGIATRIICSFHSDFCSNITSLKKAFLGNTKIVLCNFYSPGLLYFSS